MDHGLLTDLAAESLIRVLALSAPTVVAGLLVGFIISLFQAVTQIQEQTLSFIPKIVGTAVVIVVAGPWMLGQLLAYTEELYSAIPRLVGG